MRSRTLFLIYSLLFVTGVSGRQSNVPSQKSPTLALALERALPYDTITLVGGTHVAESLVVRAPLTLIGSEGATISGEGIREALTIRADSVRVAHLTIERSGVSYLRENAGVRIEGARGCVIESCLFRDNFFGIYLADSKACVIRGNRLTASAQRQMQSGNGVHFWKCRDMVVENNEVIGHRDGIYLEFVTHASMRGNHSEKNLRYGIHFMFSDSCAYVENQFVANGAGVAVMYSRAVVMKRNRFANNWGPASYGLLLKDITDSRVKNNTISGNTVGLFAEGSNRIEISGNQIIKNGWAVKIMGNCEGNTFARNDFIGNSFEVATNSRRSVNSFDGNYWSSYTGYDLDRDGIGDTPFRPVSLFAFIVERQPPALALLRSLVIDALTLAERIIPTLTPETLVDEHPAMTPLIVAP